MRKQQREILGRLRESACVTAKDEWFTEDRTIIDKPELSLDDDIHGRSDYYRQGPNFHWIHIDIMRSTI